MIQIRDSYRLPGTTHALKWLIVLCIVSFFANRGMDPSLTWAHLGFVPAEFGNKEVFAASYLADLQPGRPPGLITVITYTFLHENFFHIFFNLLFLWIFGANVERQMGAWKFTFFYFSCAAVGVLCQTVLDTASTATVIGNSGAVSGMLGAYFALFSDHDFRLTVGSPRNSFYRDVLIPFKVLLIMWIVPQLLYALVPVQGTVDRTAYMTHFGGFAAGYLLAGGKLRGLPTRTKRQFRVFRGGKAG